MVCRQSTKEHVFTNYQEIQVQEGNSLLAGSSSTKAVTVILKDDLADTCSIGETVHLTGIVVRQSTATSYGNKATVTLALQASSLIIETPGGTNRDIKMSQYGRRFVKFWSEYSEQRFVGRDSIIRSVCPVLSGMFGVKLSILLILLGGTSTDSEENDLDFKSLTRSEIHFLLVGDPGTGKSQIQRYITRLCPRAVITGGASTSSAGLTAAAVKENGQWSLEAGALVLANGSVCCIDEIDGLKPSESSALHEAMEQQTCSIAKAGMISTLRTKVSVFGTCNPRGNRRIDTRRPLADQLDLPSPLLSRFDIILLLVDDMNPASDELIVDHILNMRGHGNVTVEDTNGASDVWDEEMLRSYISWCKINFKPVLTKQSERALTSYYQKRRLAGTDHVTVRLLESLIRVSQAHARLMAKNFVDIDDAVTAIALIDSSIGFADGGILQIPYHLRIGEAGYFMNTDDSSETKAHKLKQIVLTGLDLN